MNGHVRPRLWHLLVIHLCASSQKTIIDFFVSEKIKNTTSRQSKVKKAYFTGLVLTNVDADADALLSDLHPDHLRLIAHQDRYNLGLIE